MLIIAERFLFYTLLVALLAVLATQAPQWYTTLLPGIQQVKVTGNFIHIDRVKIEKAINDAVAGDFFDANIELLEQQLERAKWIKSVWIERIWPHTLSIKIEEREAIARWGEDTLIDSEGQLFKTEDGYTPSLPFVYGAVGREKFLLNEYYQMSQRLQTVNLSLYLLEESPRGFLYLVLNNGWHLHLGEKLWQERLQKFIVVYRTTLSQDSDALAKIKCLDFRYAYGFTTSTNSAECFT